MNSKFSEKAFPKLLAVVKSLAFWSLFLGMLVLASLFGNLLFPLSWERFVYGILGTMAALLITLIFLKIDKQTFASYELVCQKGTLIRFFKGFLVGTAIFTAILIILLSFSTLELKASTNAWHPWSAFLYLAIIPLALMEEIAFRAYPFLKLKKAFGLRITQVFVAIAFALYHFIQGWGFQISFLGPGIWALVFGLGAVCSKGIALPTGIHSALNLGQQLIGMNGKDLPAIWVLDHPVGISGKAMAQANAIGFATQVLVLVSALLLTEYYIRKGKTDDLPKGSRANGG